MIASSASGILAVGLVVAVMCAWIWSWVRWMRSAVRGYAWHTRQVRDVPPRPEQERPDPH